MRKVRVPVWWVFGLSLVASSSITASPVTGLHSFDFAHCRSLDLEAQAGMGLGFRDLGFDCYTTASPADLLAAGHHL